MTSEVHGKLLVRPSGRPGSCSGRSRSLGSSRAMPFWFRLLLFVSRASVILLLGMGGASTWNLQEWPRPVFAHPREGRATLPDAVAEPACFPAAPSSSIHTAVVLDCILLLSRNLPTFPLLLTLSPLTYSLYSHPIPSLHGLCNLIVPVSIESHYRSKSTCLPLSSLPSLSQIRSFPILPPSCRRVTAGHCSSDSPVKVAASGQDSTAASIPFFATLILISSSTHLPG